MVLHRLGLRASQQILSPVLRTNLRQLSSTTRRSANIDHLPGSASTTGKQLVGTADNSFNRERAAVKAHAAATSGTSHESLLSTAYEESSVLEETHIHIHTYFPFQSSAFNVREKFVR